MLATRAFLSLGGLLFVNSDDVLEHDAFETLMAAYDEGGCDYVPLVAAK